YDRIVVIEVGPDDAPKKFSVYRGLLCFHSKYFDNMLNGGFRETGSDHLRLPDVDVDVDVFQIFYDWMNTGSPRIMGLNSTRQMWNNIMKLYVFADYYQVDDLKNTAVDLYLNFFLDNWMLLVELSNYIYDNTTASAKLRKLHVHLHCEAWKFKGIEQIPHFLPKDFLIDIIATSREMQ
ncbi:hypothetical protein CC80DRAFT_385016, partial [Byssothecium circinans]